MSSLNTQDKNFTGCQAVNFRTHNVTDVTDLVASYRLDGALVYFSPADDKHLAIWDSQQSALVKLARVDRDIPEVFDTIAAMKAAPATAFPAAAPKLFILRGVNAKYDSGYRLYCYDHASASTADDNAVVALTNVSGRCHLLFG